jgi:hypothetical protein
MSAYARCLAIVKHSEYHVRLWHDHCLVASASSADASKALMYSASAVEAQMLAHPEPAAACYWCLRQRRVGGTPQSHCMDSVCSESHKRCLTLGSHRPCIEEEATQPTKSEVQAARPPLVTF